MVILQKNTQLFSVVIQYHLIRLSKRKTSATWTNSKLSHRHHTGEREGDSSGGCEAIKIMAPHAP